MKKWLLILSMITLTACSTSTDGYKKISGDEAKKMMDGKAIVLDVRSAQEYADGHIEGAINISVDEIDRVTEEIEDRSTKVLIYCRSGNRSASAAKRLVALGYTDVYDFGGLNTWRYETVK